MPSSELILHLNEITNNPSSNVGKIVRVKGFLKEFDATINRAILEYEDSNLYLNTDITHPFAFEPGKLIECIGEICYDDEQQRILLRPNIVRSIDTLDMKLFEQAGKYKRQYIEKLKSIDIQKE
ncbi:telomere-capping, CST complex subunit-domain-containing protein [Circinella umbellata]|nr:telomere-capping, CST complex subunit-domain-containing protein [Circinella umbellata]